jgi:hypothetical protein
MSLVDVAGHVLVPGFLARNVTIPYTVYATLDANGELCGAIIRIPRTGTLAKIGVRVRSVSVADAIKVSLQTVDDATGRPTGTLYAANATGIIESPGALTTYWASLNSGTGVSVTKNDLVAIVIEFNSYVSGNLAIDYGIGMPAAVIGNPYCYSYLGGTWSLSVAAIPNFGLEYLVDAAGVIVPVFGCLPGAYGNVGRYNSTSNPNRRGLRFQFPFACRAIGAWATVDLDGPATLSLYGSDGFTILDTATLDPDVRGSTGAAMYYWLFTSPLSPTKDANYRLALLPASETNVGLSYFDLTDDGAVAAMAGSDGGINWHYTASNGVPDEEADWTQTLTRRPMMGLILDQLDNGVGGSGGGRIPRAQIFGRG